MAVLAGMLALCATAGLCRGLTDPAAAQETPGASAPAVARSVRAVVPRRWPPQYQLDRDGKPAGFAIDIMDAVARIAGVRVTYETRDNFPETIEALRRGEADLIPNIGIIAERQADFAFTAPVETFVVSLFVRKATKDILGPADLPGRKLAVVEKNVGAYMFRGRTDIDVQVYPDIRAAILQLLSGRVDALVYPRPVVLKVLGEMGIEGRAQAVGGPLKEIRRAIAVSKGNRELLALLNRAVQRFVGTPAYQRVYTRWYGRPPPYWSASRIVWAMSAVLVAVLFAMALWRFRTAVRLNRKLRQAADEISQKSSLLEMTLEHMDHGFCVFDADRRMLAFNQKFVDIHDFPPSFIRVGLRYEELLRYLAESGLLSEKADDIEELIRDRTRSVGRGEPRISEVRLPNGTYHVYSRLPLPDGGFVVTYTDVTERKRAEHEAAEKSLLLGATFQNMSQGVAVFDPDQRLVAYNEKYEDFGNKPPGFLRIGMKREEILRQRVDTGTLSDAEVSRRLEGPEVGLHFRRENRHPDGRVFLYERTPLPTGGVIATYTDITDLKMAEERVRQAQKMEAVGQLTGGIAHDFNNLLAVSIGNIELAQEKARNCEDILPFLDTIKRANERGASLTDQLLAFSRSQTLFPMAIDAGDLVAKMSDLLRSALGETIEIDVRAAEDLWPCEVDPNQLESAILNLAINARDAMPDGGKLTIRTENLRLDETFQASGAEVSPGEYVLVSVTDTGTGMTRDVIDHVFDPFFTTKEVGHGTGLGLSMVYGFVKQSAGHVTIHSEEGSGTDVRLYLPRCHKVPRMVEPDDRQEIPQGFGQSVLVVEDDPDVRALAVELIRGFGYEVLEAEDGEGALRILGADSDVKLLFTDVVLPGGMGGPELAAEVRRLYPRILILYTSGYSDVAAFDASALGPDTSLLRKPYRKVDLARKIRQTLRKAAS